MGVDAVTMPTPELDSVAEAIGALRREVARLAERIAALENGTGVSPSPPTPLSRGERGEITPPLSSRGREVAGEEVEAAPITEELLAVISAAVAAFLGKKAPIRQIRLIGTTTWAQLGRATIQASHALSARHMRNPQ